MSETGHIEDLQSLDSAYSCGDRTHQTLSEIGFRIQLRRQDRSKTYGDWIQDTAAETGHIKHFQRLD